MPVRNFAGCDDTRLEPQRNQRDVGAPEIGPSVDFEGDYDNRLEPSEGRGWVKPGKGGSMDSDKSNLYS